MGKLLAVFALLLGATSAQAKAAQIHPIDLDFQASSRMYEMAWAKEQASHPKILADDPQLQAVIAAGKRNLAWLVFINQHRATPLTFTIPGSLKGIPIDAPQSYSGTIEIQRYIDLLAAMPAGMKSIIVDGADFTENPPCSDEDYSKYGHKMDVIYQTAIRWQMAQNYLDYYREARQYDIRGYYFLNQQTDLQKTLQNWAQLPADQQAQLKTWLMGECYNYSQSDAICQYGFDDSVASNSLWQYHQNYVTYAKATYDAFFNVEQRRGDVIWTQANPNLTTVPFQDPGLQDIHDYLQTNIQDEWKWDGWQLQLDFAPGAAAHVEFKDGVVPHVNGIAGDIITMDKNTPLTEWEMQWTIRHEFGHVMGFPDCYVEFYDDSQAAMVTYQLDVTNLMCAQGGKFQQQHLDHLREAYLQ